MTLDYIKTKLDNLEKRLVEVERQAMSDGYISWLESIHINTLKGTIGSLRLIVGEKEEQNNSTPTNTNDNTSTTTDTTTDDTTQSDQTTDNTTDDNTNPEPQESKNELGLTTEDVKEKLGNFFAAFDKFTVVVDGTTVEVETPYYMNERGRSHKWDGNTVTAGKGSPKEVQEWLQEKIDKGKISSKDPAKLRKYLKDNKIGVDCSGFVSQALNHVADKDGDMEYEKGEDEFMPDNTGSGTFKGSKFKKVEPANVQIGDTLYFKNPTGGVNHIRIVGDVRNEDGNIYYTIYESAGSTGPRKMEWRYADGNLQEFRSSKWVTKKHETFYRWKKLEMDVPTGGGPGTGQQQDQQNGGNTDDTITASSTLTGSVGAGGDNKKSDVLLVQQLLNKKDSAGLDEDGLYGKNTRKAIENFQQKTFGWKDGLIGVGGKTWGALSEGISNDDNNQQNTDDTTDDTQTDDENTSNDNTNDNTDDPVTNTEVTPNSTLQKSVGKGGVNDIGDVALVQKLLNVVGAKLAINGQLDSDTEEAIKYYQQSVFNGNSDGSINPGKKTIQYLVEGRGSAVDPSKGIKQNLDDLIDDEHQGENGLGIGAEEGDEYKSQRDNETLHLEHTKSRTFGNDIVGDIQCNVTSLAMLLIATNKGDEAGVVALVKGKLEAKNVSLKSSWGLEELLAKYVDVYHKQSIFSSSLMGTVAADLFGDKISKSRIVACDNSNVLQKIKNDVLPAIKKGAEVLISAKYSSSGGHITFLRSLKSKGLVINDPYGLCIKTGEKYVRNSKAYSKSTFEKYEELFKRRLSLRPGVFETVKQKIMAGEALPADMGSNNFYSWDDFIAVNPYRFVITEDK